MRFTRRKLKDEGFQGLVTVKELRGGRTDDISKFGGVYVVLREIDNPPFFLDENPGGRFKGKNPTVSKNELQNNWVDEAYTIYIGKGSDLRRRIKQLVDYGAGKPIGHLGGRLMWQVENSEEFIIAWRYMDDEEEPSNVESQLLEDFHDNYGRLPLANLTF